MTTELTRYQAPLARFQPQTLQDIMNMATMFEASGMFPSDSGKTQTAAQLAVKILAGQELGLTPFAAANGMQIIKGKCTPSANIMAAKVKGSGGRYDYRVNKMTDTEVSIEFFETGKSLGVSTFTASDAQRAGTQNMGKFPRNMLFARALSNGVRWYCPDLFNGVAVYTPDEMGATVDYETGEILSAPVEAGTVINSRQAIITEPVATLPVSVPPTVSAPAPTGDRCPECNAPNGRPHGTGCSHRTNGKPAVTPEDRQPVPSLAELDAIVEQAMTPTPAEALRINALEIIESGNIKAPSQAQIWAVEQGYRSNDHSARTRWKEMIDEQFGGTLQPPKMKEAVLGYIELCLLEGKKEPVTA